MREVHDYQPKEDQSTNIAALEALLTHPDAGSDTREKIEQQIRNIRAGDKGEKEVAYEVDFYYGKSMNWAIIHDLRIEHAGRVAQIDHLFINRFLEIWVCESKHFSEGIAVNEYGECSAFFKGRAYGVASPLEQNKKHVAVLSDLFKTERIQLPTRIGFTLRPTLSSMILVSKNARISRSKASLAGLESILKVDQFKQHIDKSIDADNNPFTFAKVISSLSLKDFARQLASLHQPIEFNWAARFGLASQPRPAPTMTVVASSAPSQRIAERATPPTTEARSSAAKLVRTYACTARQAMASYAEARFCWFNKQKFGGNVYCRACQKAA